MGELVFNDFDYAAGILLSVGANPRIDLAAGWLAISQLQFAVGIRIAQLDAVRALIGVTRLAQIEIAGVHLLARQRGVAGFALLRLAVSVVAGLPRFIVLGGLVRTLSYIARVGENLGIGDPQRRDIDDVVLGLAL